MTLADASPRRPCLQRLFVVGLVAAFAVPVVALIAIWSGGPPFAPTEVLLENTRPESIVVQLADGRAWEVPPNGWGPAVPVDAGTRATIYSAGCERLADVTFHRGSGFIINANEPPREFSFGDIIVTTAPHPGCA